MGREMHENLEKLDQAIEELDPSPSELLILFNHMVGRLSATIEPLEWRAALDRGVLYVHESRATRP